MLCTQDVATNRVCDSYQPLTIVFYFFFLVLALVVFALVVLALVVLALAFGIRRHLLSSLFFSLVFLKQKHLLKFLFFSSFLYDNMRRNFCNP